MTWSTWLVFLSVSLAAAFTPGPGVLMAITTASTQGAGRALYSSAGNALGVFIVATGAVAGLGLVLKTSALAFGLVKVAGAAYLIYLGVQTWRRASRESTPASGSNGAPTILQASRLATFRAGLLVAVSNPKAILFFTAIFPQFMPLDRVDVARFLMLTSAFTACTLLSHLFYVAGATWVKRRVKGSAASARLAKRGTAALFVGMGGALLTVK
ncbi:LysE family translocator [Massilia oculi]|uniref:LysE family translocator n=1 Tax=Massilia oculi TaxID=945844 RepID=UPI001AAFFBA0|nr:LysE family translocator [Massilia oculi]